MYVRCYLQGSDNGRVVTIAIVPIEGAVLFELDPEQHPLRSLAGKMSNFLIVSRSVNTSKKYFYAFSRWKTFVNFTT